MTQLRGLIFDLDGTLLDSAPDLRHAVNAVLKQEGHEALALDAIASMVGDGMGALMARAFAAAGEPNIPRERVQFLGERFLEAYQQLQPDPSQIYPHTVAMLERMRDAGIKMGLCTNKQEAATHQLLQGLDLDKFFGFVAGYDTFAVHKPHPGHVLGVVKALGLLPETCVMLGDSSNDLLSAQGAGVKCIIVTHGYGAGLTNLSPDGQIGNFIELPSALARLGFHIAV